MSSWPGLSPSRGQPNLPWSEVPSGQEGLFLVLCLSRVPPVLFHWATRAGGHLSSKDSPAFCFQASCCWSPALGFFSPGSYRQPESQQVRKRSPERRVGKLVQELYGRTRSKGVSCQGVNKEAAECHPVLSWLSTAIVTRASRAGGCENCFPRGLGELSLARKYEAAGEGASAEIWRCWEVRVGQDQP